MGRLSKALTALAAVGMMVIPASAAEPGVLGDIGGLDTLVMAALLLAFGYFLQNFKK